MTRQHLDIIVLLIVTARVAEGTAAIWTTTASSTRSPSVAAAHQDSIVSAKPSHVATIMNGNSTVIITTSNTTARTGDVVFLPCETPQSMGKQVQVSWVRRNDWHILTSGLQTYTKEQRFAVHHPKDSNEWTLAIKYVKLSDEGTYECQIVGGSTSMSQLVHLSVVTPRAVIPGNGEYHVDAGSTISLVCFIQEIAVAPPYIFWYHNSRMINYDRERGGISVEIDSEPKVRSRLTVSNAKTSDSGNYTCDAANTEPASITVYITQVNQIAAVQPRAVEASNRAVQGCGGVVWAAVTMALLLLSAAITAADVRVATYGLRTLSNTVHFEPD